MKKLTALLLLLIIVAGVLGFAIRKMMDKKER